MNYTTVNFFEHLVFLIIVVIIAILAFAYFINTSRSFISTRSYIKMEIARSEDEERDHWKRKLKEFYISYIPVVGRILIRKQNKEK